MQAHGHSARACPAPLSTTPTALAHTEPTPHLDIDNDDYFELMVRNAWHLSGGEGWSENTSCRRVLVTHTDGRQTVEEIKVWT